MVTRQAIHDARRAIELVYRVVARNRQLQSDHPLLMLHLTVARAVLTALNAGHTLEPPPVTAEFRSLSDQLAVMTSRENAASMQLARLRQQLRDAGLTPCA